MSSKTATHIRDLADVPAVNGTRKLWRFDPPLVAHDWDGNAQHEYVVSSAVNAYAHETYLFPGDEAGKIVDWRELPGSIKNTTNHEAAIRAAGYEPVTA